MTDREVMQQALEALENSVDLVRHEYNTDWRHGLPTRKAQLDGMKEGLDAHEATITALKAALEQQAEPVAQRSDGMPISKTERELRRMLCIERHGRSAYMDDGEASFCGDKYCRSIDYMRESIESIRQAWYDAGAKKLAGAQPEQQAEPVAEKFEAMHANGNVWITTIGAAAVVRNTPPPQRQWVGLTDEDVNRESAPIASQMKLAFHAGMYVAQQILKEKNGG